MGNLDIHFFLHFNFFIIWSLQIHELEDISKPSNIHNIIKLVTVLHIVPKQPIKNAKKPLVCSFWWITTVTRNEFMMLFLMLLQDNIFFSICFCGCVPWLYQYWPGGFMLFVVLCPGIPEGLTGSGSDLKHLRRWGNGLKSHPTDWEKPGIEPATPGLQDIGLSPTPRHISAEDRILFNTVYHTAKET